MLRRKFVKTLSTNQILKKMETTAQTTQTQAVTDAKTRELNAKAKMQALKDMASPKTKKADKPTATKVEAVKPKKEPVISVTSLIDAIIVTGGKWQELADRCNEATKGKGNIKYTVSVLKAHVRYRTITQKRTDYLGDFVTTDEGIMPAKPKSKSKK